MHKATQFLSYLLFTFLMSFTVTATAASPDGLFQRASDPVAGNPRGPITIVEFFDYQCGHCAAMAPVISGIINANPDVRVVFKELPIRGSMSQFASRAALAANKQGKYYRFNHALMNSRQPLTESTVMQIAENTGLNVNRLKKDMSSRDIYQQLSYNTRLAQTLQVTGTPAFFIGKTNATNMNDIDFVLGEMSQRELQNAINKLKR